MKRIRLWLRELSLTQQLISIVFFAITVFALFIFSVISPQINSFTSKEMYRMLHGTQYTVAFYLNHMEGSMILPQEDETAVLQGIYDPTTDCFAFNTTELIRSDILDDIRQNIADGVEGVEDRVYRPKDHWYDNNEIHYCLSHLQNRFYLVTMIASSYEAQFRSQLVNNVVNLNVFVAAVLLLLLTMWAASIIYPLSQIQSYINKIKNDDPAELSIVRHDEIGEVADALRDMQAELCKQNREKQEMIQNISHDLKTPIATIRSYGESIKDGVYPYGTLEQSVDVIIEHADRLDKKVRSLIALNKMDYLLDTCPSGNHLSMAQIIDKALLSLKVLRPEISFETHLDRSVLFHGEEEPWRIVLENLLDNALRYAKTKIWINLETDRLVVGNDGRLIEEDRLEKLFRPYEKGTDGQFGLGLSIVYRVCMTYGYHVEADNLTDGVCFVIWKDSTKKIRQKKSKAQRDEHRAQG